jgi:hypothetical protein
MKPTDKLAAIRALIIGATAVQKQAEDEVRDYRAETGAKGFTTPFGEISFRKNPPTIAYDQAALLEWARENMPHEVVEEHQVTVPAAVRPSLLKTLESRLGITPAGVIDLDTGEFPDFATVVEGKPDSVVFTPSREQRAEAAALVAARIEALASAVQPEVEAS